MSGLVPTRAVEYRLFEAFGEPCGVLVTDRESGECAFRFRRDWESLTPPPDDDYEASDSEVLAGLAAELPERCAEMGTAAFLAWIDDTLSNTFRAEPPRASVAVDLQRTAQALFRRHVETAVRAFETHLPLIPIDLAAGGLGEDRATGAAEWVDVELPGRKHLGKDLFLVRIHGRSMEPEIPDGSLCLFRPYQGGSRQGGIYIVQRRGSLDEGGEFTIKRYTSAKVESGGSWRHAAIGMQPDNPEFAEWALNEEEDRWATVAQFLAVVEDPLP